MQLAKVAKHTGKPYILDGEPPEEGWAAFAANELKKNGLTTRKTVYDPVLGREIPALGEGYSYMSAFHHLSEKKMSGRATGGYTADREPGKSGKNAAKRMSAMDYNALLAHGAHEVIKDAHLIRGVQNQDYWTALKLGQPLPEPGVPFIYEKLVNTMKAGGINMQKKGDILSVMPMTNSDMDKLVGKRFLNGSATVDAKTMEPIKGGLFDQTITGGLQGNRWSAVKLSEPIPNPVMEEPIRRLLGLKVKEMADVIAGAQEIDGRTGGEGIRSALAQLDVDKEIKRHRERIQKFKGANRDNSVKALRYLMGAKKQGIHPSDWVIDKVPIIPPVFRPVSQVGDMLKPADLNGLYRDLIEVNNNIGELRKDIPDSDLAEEKLELYRSVQAAFGLGQPTTEEGASKRWKGAIRQVIGNSPKTGMLQAKVLSKNVDMVARGVIAPDPTYDMDTVGIPVKKAWTVYEPFIIRRLVKRGFPPTRAKEMVAEKDKEAKEMMLEEMKQRPVIVDRAPTWHKFNLQAFNPVLVDDDVIRVSPLIVGGFNADFDGDQMSIHVPVSDKAVAQAKEKMMPSKNLFSLTDLKSVQHKPSKEMSMGLYQLTKDPTNKPPQVFKSVNELKRALKDGLVGINDPVIIQDAK
jgi:DNA-directed RNA polymerase beta' subunit